MAIRDNYTKITLDYPVQTLAEERKMVTELKDRNPQKLRDLLVLHNIGLVVYWAKKLCFAENRKEEYISWGLVGMMNAARKFDFNSGFKFANYASMAIRNEIIKSAKPSKVDRACYWLQTPVNGNADDSDEEFNVETFIHKYISPEYLVVKPTWTVVEDGSRLVSVKRIVEELKTSGVCKRSYFKQMFDCYGRGQTLAEVARRRRCCRESVRQHIERARTAVVKHMMKKYGTNDMDELKRIVLREIA